MLPGKAIQEFRPLYHQNIWAQYADTNLKTYLNLLELYDFKAKIRISFKFVQSIVLLQEKDYFAPAS